MNRNLDEYKFEKPQNLLFEPQNGDIGVEPFKGSPKWYKHIKYILRIVLWSIAFILLVLMTVLYMFTYITHDYGQNGTMLIYGINFDRKGIQTLYNLIFISAFSGIVGNFFGKNE